MLNPTVYTAAFAGTFWSFPELIELPLIEISGSDPLYFVKVSILEA